MAANEDRYVFHVEWFDAQADVIRRYMFTFYPRDNSIEMFDPKNRRPFLKRSEAADIALSGLYIGAVVTVLARQLKVIDYADDYTRQQLENRKGRTLALVKPDAYNHIGTVLTAVQAAGFVIARLRMVRMTAQQATAFCRMQSGEAASPEHAKHLQADVCVAMELVGDDAVGKWQAIVGPADPRTAKYEAPKSLRAHLAVDSIKNAVHGSDDPSAAASEVDFFFGTGGGDWPTTAVFNNCTLCVVRPHSFHTAGEIVSRILAEGFEISAMAVWHMDRATAEEFLEVYKGVLPEYHDSCSQLCTGPSLVMEVRQENAVPSLRKLVGPHDPEVAKHLRPGTLRAKYGLDRVKNAVHCTDLTEDGLLEVEYFFNILYNRTG
eukprot:TRINITY_DN58009_c0_g1_i1.p1 TRINITY_DN58009_c0_g1~~TRINITY_DN58009_c0_g1_i1.p1  ORF type:complete len:378 (+),score=75.22 TRINITY_DN58009_c0_g1_i1:161-1294(+)